MGMEASQSWSKGQELKQVYDVLIHMITQTKFTFKCHRPQAIS